MIEKVVVEYSKVAKHVALKNQILLLYLKTILIINSDDNTPVMKHD